MCWCLCPDWSPPLGCSPMPHAFLQQLPPAHSATVQSSPLKSFQEFILCLRNEFSKVQGHKPAQIFLSFLISLWCCLINLNFLWSLWQNMWPIIPQNITMLILEHPSWQNQISCQRASFYQATSTGSFFRAHFMVGKPLKTTDSIHVCAHLIAAFVAWSLKAVKWEYPRAPHLIGV